VGQFYHQLLSQRKHRALLAMHFHTIALLLVGGADAEFSEGLGEGVWESG
jgi:hypothetical protein